MYSSDNRSDLDQDEDIDEGADDEDEDEGQGSGYGSDNDYADWSGEAIHDDSDDDSSTKDSPGRYTTIAPVDPPADLVLRLAYYMITEDFEDGRSNSTMLVFLAPSGDSLAHTAKNISAHVDLRLFYQD